MTDNKERNAARAKDEVMGVVPRNPEIRAALFFPRVMPSERKPRARREVVKIGQPGWESVYFKKVRK